MTEQTTPRKTSEKRQRQKQVKLRLTPDEFNAVAAKASDAGLSNAAYARAAMLGDAGPRAQRKLPVDAAQLRIVLAQLGRYGNNLNQLAYQFNATGKAGLESEYRTALKEWGEIRDACLVLLGRNPEPLKPR